MLRVIRNGVDTIFVRIVLGLIAVTFVGFGGFNLMSGNSMGKAISFKHVPDVTIEEFESARNHEMSRLQQLNPSINPAEEEARRAYIDHLIVAKLIRSKMLDYLADQYDLSISDDYVINYVKKLPVFQNKDGKFDVEIFKSAFKGILSRETEYLNFLKKDLVNSNIYDVFVSSFHVPKIMSDSTMDMLSEVKEVYVYSMDVNSGLALKKIEDQDPSDEIISEIYNSDPKAFTLEETRSFKLLKIKESDLSKNFTVTDEELKNFFDENTADFQEKDFDKAKNKVKEAVVAMKLEEAIVNTVKDLEEDAAKGLNIDEISEKYSLATEEKKDLSKASLKNNTEYHDLSEQLFEITIGELSYPSEIRENNEIIIAQLTDIKPAKVQTLDEVKSQIIDNWKKQQIKEQNLKSFSEFRSSLNKIIVDGRSNPDHKKDIDSLKNELAHFNNPESLKKHSVTLDMGKKLLRYELEKNKDYPQSLLERISLTDKGNNTPIVTDGTKLYFAFIKDAYIDKKEAAKLKGIIYDNYAATIGDAVLNDIISYLAKENQTKINLQK